MVQKPHQGLRTFLKSPIDDMSRRFGVLGIPFDGATSNRPGARFGPSAIREASLMLTDGLHPVYNQDPSLVTTDLGDIHVSNVDVAKSLKQIEDTITDHPFLAADRRNHLISLGGDHTITLGVLRALVKSHSKPAIIHFDAHCDTWPDHFGDPLGHGTWVRNAIEEGLVDPNQFVSIGIRSPSDLESRHYLEQKGGLTITGRGLPQPYLAARQVMEKIGTNTPVYLTFDIDAIDPSQAPGTGTPEIGGITTKWVLEFLNTIKFMNFIGMDMVEVAPAYDHAQLTSLTAATLVWEYIAMNAGGSV